MDDEQIRVKLYELIEAENQDALYQFLEDQELPNSVDALIAYDEDCVTELNVEGEAPLHVAVRRNDEESVKILLDAGADVNATVQSASVYSGYTPLHFAASQGFLKIATMLLDRKDIRVSGGSSFGHVGAPIHVSVLSGNDVMTEMLLDKGADVTELTSFGHSPLAVAASKGSVSLVRILLKRLKQHPESLSSILIMKDRHGDTCLHLALQSQCNRVFNYNYPLTENHIQIAYDLILHGADTSIRNNDGDTALDLIHPDLAFFCEFVSDCREDFRCVDTVEAALNLTLPQLEQMPAAKTVASQIYKHSQAYLADPEGFVLRREAENDPDAPPCTLVDSKKIPNIRKFSHLTSEQRSAASKSPSGASSATEKKCPMGFTGKNPHAKSSTASGGKCPMGFSKKEEKKSHWDMLQSSSFWFQAIGGLAVAAVVGLAIVRGQKESS